MSVAALKENNAASPLVSVPLMLDVGSPSQQENPVKNALSTDIMKEEQVIPDRLPVDCLCRNKTFFNLSSLPSPEIFAVSTPVNSTAESWEPKYPIKCFYNVAGAKYYKPAIDSIGISNPFYSFSPLELIKSGLDEQQIPKFIFNPTEVNFVDEPDNPYDPNALKIIADGTHIGYIPKYDTESFRDDMNAGRIKKIKCEIKVGNIVYIITTQNDLRIFKKITPHPLRFLFIRQTILITILIHTILPQKPHL